MSLFVESLLTGWDRNLDYAKKLVSDLTDEQMVLQPVTELNHPAWCFAHVCAYHPVIAGLVRGADPQDPLNHRFGMKSKPEADASLYGSRDEVIAAYEAGHVAVSDALKAADDAAFERAMPIERWQKPFPKVGTCLGYLMLVHESTHLGQVSAWRRVQGLPRV